MRRKALDRIENIPDWIARVGDAGRQRQAERTYVLSSRTASLPDAVMERCWSIAESVAEDQTKLLQEGTLPTESDERKPHASVVAMGNQSGAERQRHGQQIAAVSDLLHAAKVSTGPSPLDYWVRQS